MVTHGWVFFSYLPAYVDEQKVLHIVLRDAHEDALEECRSRMRTENSGSVTAAAGDGGGQTQTEALESSPMTSGPAGHPATPPSRDTPETPTPQKSRASRKKVGMGEVKVKGRV